MSRSIPGQATLDDRLRQIVGDRDAVAGEIVRRSTPAWQTHQPCNARLLLRPADTDQVSRILALCNAAGQSVVTYGGVTNLVQACATTPADIVISLARMNRVEEIDVTAQTMIAEAGITLLDAQQAASEADLFYPVDIGARDSCTLGGNVSTNAGGTKVIRYGMTRDNILGLEAVLADGTVLSSMNRYIKNNSGFDLKQLFVGTEGVLGIVTRVVVRLGAKPRSHNVALVACNEFSDVLAVLELARRRIGANLCGFEVMWNSFYSQVTQPVGRQPAPVAPGLGYYVIVEAMGSDPAGDDESFATAMTAMFDDACVVDGVIAKSAAERDALWGIRHDVEWIVSGCVNFDVSLRVADVANFVAAVEAAVAERVPAATVAAFGHLGDNNLHMSVVHGNDVAVDRDAIEALVYGELRRFGGAISAEHGIGLEKRAWLSHSRSDEEIATMRRLKRALDPRLILNPGKVFAMT